ncbi:MAG TPA: TIGR03435 family protein [Bryobacteraceae bacterium]|jgi:uncharacterized protein (TIGR03435 family)|nr:TIGR03435 family protein [Bryobacteraceae bacterium]
MAIAIKARLLLAASLFSCASAQPVFDVASVKPNKSNNPPTFNFPLGPGDTYVANGGFLAATNFPLGTYIAFAYKMQGSQMQSLMKQLPEWVMTDRFDIQARAEGNPGKDQMRLMMRALLADRFKLAMHSEARETSVFAFVLLKPGVTGPNLRPHPADSSCPDPASGTPLTIAGGFPALCGGLFPMAPSVAGRLRFGARNVTISFIANSLSAGSGIGRPMVDQTGLSGTFDFTIEFTPEDRRGSPPDAAADNGGPTLVEALREQLGIKLESRKSQVDMLVVDHVEHLIEN